MSTDRADSLERQKEQVDVLRKQLETPETFRKVYIFAFDYAKTEGQKSLRAWFFLSASAMTFAKS